MADKLIPQLVRGLCALLLFTAVQGVALAGDQQDLVDAADLTLSNLLRDPNMSWLQYNFDRAKAVIIAPVVVKAGFIFGGSGGRAVTVARDTQTGKWSGPAFYTLATASFGFQAGVSVSEVVTLVMTERGLNSLLSASAKLGGDASITAGPVGVGASSALLADFISFSRSKGLYGGVNLDGTVVAISNEWNGYYYKAGVLPPDILIRGTVHNPGADKLLEDVAKAAAAASK
jgi:lipid-binding SYLF domain-containing protein